MSTLQDVRTLRAAVMRAALADDRESADRLREEGARLVAVLNGLVRQCRLGVETGMRAAAAELLPVLGRLVDALGVLQLEPAEAGLEMNGLLLRFRSEEQAAAQQLAQELLRHQASALQIHGPLTEAEALLLGQALADPAGRPGRAATTLGQRLQEALPLQVLGRGSEAAPPAAPLDPWALALEGLRAAYGALAAGRLPDVRALRRAAAELATETAAHPDRALGVTLWPWPMRAGEHAILACTTLGLRLGQALALGPAALEDLAVASLLQAASPSAAALRLSSPRGAHAGKLRRLLPVLELAGPAPEGEASGQAGHLFSRLLRIARDYVLLVVERPGQPRLAPPMAQGMMWAARGGIYDTDLLALMVQQLGLYPPGSLVELSDGRAAVSLSGGRDAERFAWPLVAILRRPNGPAATEPGDGPGPGGGRIERLDLHDERGRLRPKRVLSPGSVPCDLSALWSE